MAELTTQVQLLDESFSNPTRLKVSSISEGGLLPSDSIYLASSFSSSLAFSLTISQEPFFPVKSTRLSFPLSIPTSFHLNTLLTPPSEFHSITAQPLPSCRCPQTTRRGFNLPSALSKASQPSLRPSRSTSHIPLGGPCEIRMSK